jgi:peptidoglycan hydrolase-like protein with peptidoglycan-binding domain
MKKNTTFGKFITVSVLASAVLTTQVFAYNTINTQLDFGETNADVTNLQTLFRDNSAIYPEGLVTGYYGSLSRSAVERFQIQKNIVSSGSAATTGFGRVGPSTRDAINQVVNAGGWMNTSSSDISGPAIFNVTRNISNNSVAFTWSTDELASAKVFYNTIPVTMNEGDINSVGFGSTNGFTAINDSLARQSQQIMINNLSPNTQYYYVIVATDLKGNVSVWNPNTSFRTNP